MVRFLIERKRRARIFRIAAFVIGPHITVEELDAFQSKTDRYLKLRELLLDHSSDSNLVVM